MDNEAFAEARRRVLGETVSEKGIGTLSEKALHRILKLTVEPDENRHEVKTEGFVADVLSEDGVITEIQTANFGNLAAKLPVFLTRYPVRVVYPLPHEKYLRWIDPDTGEMTPRRLVPKKGRPADAFRELYRIREFLTDPRLTLSLVFLDVEEYRLRNGWDKTGKRGSHKVERLPLSIASEITLNGTEDYRRLFLPAELNTPFTVGQFAKFHRTTYRSGYTGMRILTGMGLLFRVGKRGREYLFSTVPGNETN